MALRAGAFTVAGLFIGAFLIFTAAAKIHGLGRAELGVSFLSSRPMQIAVIEVEIVVAVWLLSGRAARLAWFATLGLFGLFAGASAYMMLVGQRSCGCLGAVPLASHEALALDAAILALLCFCRPPRVGPKPDAVSLPIILRTAGTVLLLSGLVGGAFWLFAGDPARALAWLRDESVVVQPAVSEVGEGRVREERSFRIQLTNHSARPIRLTGGIQTCLCTSTDDLPLTILPHESASLNVRMMFGGTIGRFQHEFKLYSDDDLQPVIAPRFAGRVIVGGDSVVEPVGGNSVAD